jgi:threonine synthase
MRLAIRSEGVSVCPESAACVGAAIQLLATGWIRPDERVLLYNCGAAQKYVDVAPLDLPRIPAGEFKDWDRILRG